MKIATSSLLLTALGLTASCATTTTSQRIFAERGHDVPCLRRQVVDARVPFYQAITICQVSKPDLTGDPELQSSALASNVPFTIRPKADAEIKAYNRDQILDTGSHLSGAHPSLNVEGGVHE